MNQPSYTTAELVEATDLTLENYKQAVRRGHMVPSSGRRIGTGHSRAHGPDDVLQAAFLAHLARLGVKPRRAAMVWAMAGVPNAHRDAVILMAPRADDSDLDVRVVLPGGDGGMDRDDAPAAFAVLDLGRLRRVVAARLAALPRAAA